MPTKDCGNDPTDTKKFNRQQENNNIINSASDKIKTQENIKLSDGTEAQEVIEYEFDDNKLTILKI